MSTPKGFAIGLLSVIELTGKDRNKILNNLCTQDLRALGIGQVKETFMLDVKGRTASHGIVACMESKTLFISSPGQAQRLVPHIDRYIIREDAQVRDISSHYQAFLFEPNAPEIQSLRTTRLGQALCAENRTDGEASFCISTGWLGPQSTLIMVPPQSQDAELLELSQKCQESDCQHREGWELLRISSFWPWYGVDIDERNLPQEIGIDDRAICFNKGCYLGQETVARLDALGQVQKQLALVNIQAQKGGQIQVPWELFLEGKSIGVVTSLTKNKSAEGSIQEHWIGLAMLRRGYFQEERAWALDGGCILRVSSRV